MTLQCTFKQGWAPGRRARAIRRAGLLIAVFLAPAMALAEGDVEEVRPLAADGHVWVENNFGEIVIQAWDREEIRISGYMSDDVRELEIRESGSGIRVRVDYHDRRHIDGASLAITVPAGASVEAESVSGDIEAEGLRGEALELRTVSGDLEVAAEPQRLTLVSVSGDIDFTGTASRVEVESVSGEVELSGVDGEIRATTVSGDVTVAGGKSIQSGKFEAVSGDVELDVALAAGGRIIVSSMSGDIDLYLPRDQEAEFFAETFSGDIDTDFGRETNASRGPGSRLEYRQGGSGAVIKLNSFSGDVAVHRR